MNSPYLPLCIKSCIEKCWKPDKDEEVFNPNNACQLPPSYALLQTLSHPALTHLSDIGIGTIATLLIIELAGGSVDCNRNMMKAIVSGVVVVVGMAFVIGGAYSAQQRKNALQEYFYEAADPFHAEVEAGYMRSTIKKNPTQSRTADWDESNPGLRRGVLDLDVENSF